MLRKYNIPSQKGEGWAIIVIDTDIGFFSTVSDWGNFAYLWSSPGCEFREFLARLTPDYLHKKLLHNRGKSEVFDSEATVKTIKSAIEAMDESCLEKNKRKRGWRWTNSELKTLDKFTPMDDMDFLAWQSETHLEEPWQYRCTQPEPQAMAFCTKVWPRFKLLLEAELLKEGVDVHAT